MPLQDAKLTYNYRQDMGATLEANNVMITLGYIKSLIQKYNWWPKVELAGKGKNLANMYFYELIITENNKKKWILLGFDVAQQTFYSQLESATELNARLFSIEYDIELFKQSCAPLGIPAFQIPPVFFNTKAIITAIEFYSPEKHQQWLKIKNIQQYAASPRKPILPGARVPKQLLPALQAHGSMERLTQFVQALLQRNSGLVIGSTHTNLLTYSWLSQLFKLEKTPQRSGLSHFGWELPSGNQIILDCLREYQFFRDRFSAAFSVRNKTLLYGPAQRDAEISLLLTANDNGIYPLAIDCYENAKLSKLMESKDEKLAHQAYEKRISLADATMVRRVEDAAPQKFIAVVGALHAGIAKPENLDVPSIIIYNHSELLELLSLHLEHQVGFDYMVIVPDNFKPESMSLNSQEVIIIEAQGATVAEKIKFIRRHYKALIEMQRMLKGPSNPVFAAPNIAANLPSFKNMVRDCQFVEPINSPKLKLLNVNGLNLPEE